MISLLTWLQGLLADPEARAAFFGDPDGVTGAAGFDHLSAADVHDALVLVSDTEPVSYDDRFADPQSQHEPTDLDVFADQGPGDYLRDYLSTSYPAEAHDPGSFLDSPDNDPLAHHDWTGTAPGTDHVVAGFTDADAVDPGFGAGFGGEPHQGVDPDFASGDQDDVPVHSSEVTGPSQVDHYQDDVAAGHDSTGYESLFGEALGTDPDHADHSEHEVHHPPL